MRIWLLAAVLQAQPVPQSPLPDVVIPQPRFAVGGDLSGLAVNFSEGRSVGLAAGARFSFPVARRDAIDARISQLMPDGGSYGIYDVRWRRMLRESASLPDYFAIGAVGFYRFGTVQSGVSRYRYRDISRPQLMSVTLGWENRASARWSVPFEVTGMANPYGALIGLATIGVTWSPEQAVK